MKSQRIPCALALMLPLLAACLLPRAARADVMYTFSGVNNTTGTNNTFSFTEPTFFTTSQPFSTSFSIDGTVFTHGLFDASGGCFSFSTGSPSACSLSFGGSSFYAAFSNPIGPGTFSALGGGCGTTGGACELLSSLTISQAAATTPEPSSLLLLATGALGAAGLMRRRLRAIS